ncbi:uncharacterized protein N0V89_008430 [Didymosphaeria variabile]|uniref:Uncharacterized protein n=1 Tax=Didymosphaeria variabile TaxID=1932322 RepID=A0A9W8XFQ9_9PLEO|nr:uncharacterized protein N0V89_008430 [Didymosphaeria variabile]KAJ4349811.1 hypothetical protein N0V89_008430 [Didymosphaeria variabile]
MNSKKSGEEPARTDIPQTPVKEMPSVSLSFEASPADVPMFGPMTRTTSGSCSLRVHRSSPITVPMASREATIMDQDLDQGTQTALGYLPTGTVPDSPAPLQRASVQEAIISNAMRESRFSASSDLEIFGNPLPTPMPGTNLPLEVVAAPGIMITSPSAPSMQANDQPGYFDGVVVHVGNGYERTRSLDTESGFPTLDDARNSAMDASNEGHDDEVIPGHPTVPEVNPASFDESFPVVPMNITVATSAPKSPSGSNDYGENVAYVVYDSPGASDAGRNRKQCLGHWGRLTSHCSIHPVDNDTGYGWSETSSSPNYWTDNTEAATNDGTELTEYTSPGDATAEAAAEAKLMAAIEELDAATLHAKPQSPIDGKKALQDFVRAYTRLREGTDDAVGGLPLAEGPDSITQEMKEEVETSIRVMNRSLGG